MIFLILGVMDLFSRYFSNDNRKNRRGRWKIWIKRNGFGYYFPCFCVGILAIIARTYRLVLFRFKVNEVKLPTETVVKNSETAAETVFNKNMDEIVYFFEETKYRIVFLKI